MAGTEKYPQNFLNANAKSTKNICIVVEIDGVDLLTNRKIYQSPRYGDPIYYGDAGLTYGGLVEVQGFRDLLSLDGSSLTLQQTIEPEQGRGSVSMLTLCFIDKDGYMTEVISPGKIIDDILGKSVKIWLGYQEISYPDDYIVIARGKISQTQSASGRVILQLSDPNIGRRQQVFYTAKTTLTSGITNVSTSIPVAATGDFPLIQKTWADFGAAVDSNLEHWIKIGNEWMKYAPITGIPDATHFTVTRGGVGPLGETQTAVSHNSGDEVSCGFVISGNPLEIALKIMLSTGQKYDSANPQLAGKSFDVAKWGYTDDPDLGTFTDGFLLKQGVSATRDLGMSVGDKILITYDTPPVFPEPNHAGEYVVSYFDDVNGEPNRFVHLLNNSTGLPALLTIYNTAGSSINYIFSQFDTLPDGWNLDFDITDVDVDRHVYYKNSFLSSEAMKFLITGPETAKTFIESELYLPVSAYSVTRQGRLSVGMTLPPIADDRLQILNQDNIISPETIAPIRGLNNRKFFNEIDWTFDFNQSGTATSVNKYLDVDSLSTIGQLSVLPIQSKGSRTSLGAAALVERRSNFLLSRYKYGAIQIQLKTTFEMACIIEAGDVLLLEDDGSLKISNLIDGTRVMGSQLFEVINRTLDLRQGQGSLTLISGIGVSQQDKFATFGPASKTDVGCTTTKIHIKDSFKTTYGIRENEKWQQYVGKKIRVHNASYSLDEETTFTGFDASDPYVLTVSPALSFTPSDDYIVELAEYPNNTDATDQANCKLIHVYWTPSITVVSGISSTQFTVVPSDATMFQIGQPIYLHSSSYGTIYGSNVLSEEAVVSDVTGTTITVSTSLGYTPSAGHIVELVGFPDGGPPYRWI